MVGQKMVPYGNQRKKNSKEISRILNLIYWIIKTIRKGPELFLWQTDSRDRKYWIKE